MIVRRMQRVQFRFQNLKSVTSFSSYVQLLSIFVVKVASAFVKARNAFLCFLRASILFVLASSQRRNNEKLHNSILHNLTKVL